MVIFDDRRGAYARKGYYGYEDAIDVYDGKEKIGEVKKRSSDYYASLEYEGKREFLDGFKTPYDAMLNVKRWFSELPRNSENVRRAAAEYLPSHDREFFPTPSVLAGIMANMVDWSVVKSALEPSAGKGDLIDAARKHRKNRSATGNEKWDCIEIDENLQYILTGKNYRVVGDDFLSFDTMKRYDLILMNPPFSNGDAHLLKAVELQKRGGGQIVCLLNAETIRNPYTNRRKLLQNELAKYSAKIEFVSNGFSKAERKTGVEVAIVYVRVPAPKKVSNIIEGLKMARDKGEYDEAGPNALSRGDWVQQMIDNFDFEAKAGVELMEEYNAISPYIMHGEGNWQSPIITLKVLDNSYSSCGNEAVSKYMRSLRAKYWRMLLNRRELTDRMTTKMKEDYYNKVDELSDYDFSLFNARRIILDIGAQLSSGVEDSIMFLFEKLSSEHAYYPECKNNIHYYNGWKTNKAHKVGMKVIIPCNGAYASGFTKSGKWGATDELDERNVCSVISDLEKSLDFLNMGTVQSHRDISYEVKCAIESGSKTVQFTYFTATFYKKGTCHIKFSETAKPLVDRLNIFASRKKCWLPPNYGSTHYERMSSEEQDVVRSFHEGNVEEYETVVNNPSKYIVSGQQMQPLLTA